MNIIKSFSPTRVDLAGGTLDLWPLYNFTKKEARTINLGIDIFTYADLEVRADSMVVLESKDMNVRKEYLNLEECLNDSDPDLLLLRSIIKAFSPTPSGFNLCTRSESPVGGGLGGSSSLTISIIKAFSSWLGDKRTPEEMAYLAHNLEARVLNTPTGTQDYFPPIRGGLVQIDYLASGMFSKNLDFDESVFNTHMSLVYTGKPHHSGMNNFEVLKKAVAKDSTTLNCLNAINETTHDLTDLIAKEDWGALPEVFEKEFRYRTELSPVFSSDQIRQLKEISGKAGASGIKICGAGGGGCVMLWTEPDKRSQVEASVSEAGFKVLPNKVFSY